MGRMAALACVQNYFLLIGKIATILSDFGLTALYVEKKGEAEWDSQMGPLAVSRIPLFCLYFTVANIHLGSFQYTQPQPGKG